MGRRVGILGLLLRFRPFYAQQIGRSVGHGTFEQARHLAFDQPSQRCTIAATQHLDRLRARQEDADRAAGRAVMRTQHLERIAVACRRQRFGVRAIQPTERRRRHGAALGADTRMTVGDARQAAHRNGEPGRPVGRLCKSPHRPPSLDQEEIEQPASCPAGQCARSLAIAAEERLSRALTQTRHQASAAVPGDTRLAIKFLGSRLVAAA